MAKFFGPFTDIVSKENNIHREASMNDVKLVTKIYDIYWEGPYSLDAIDKDRNGAIVKEWHCLYQIYGDHPAYGPDVLLYIGKTE